MAEIPVEYNPWVDLLRPYEPGRPVEELARELGVAPQAVVKLASNENALGPSPAAVRALREAASRMHLYPDGSCFYLAQRIAQKLGVTSDWLVFGTGSNELIVLLGLVFLRPGVAAVMSEKSFLIYRLVTRMFGAEPIEVSMKGWTIDPGALQEAIGEDCRLVFIANPNNPTGTAVSRENLEAFLDRLPDHVLAVVDEAYVEFMPEGQAPDLISRMREGKMVCSLRTFSKIYGLAGLRIGYCVAPPPVASLLQRVRQPFNVSSVAQAAALAALEDQEHVRRTLQLVASERRYLESELRGLGMEYVRSVTNFMLVRTGNGLQTFAALQERHIIVRPMDVYGLPDFVRITIGTHEQNRRLISVLRDLPGGPGRRT
ncbi:MAG TPA: histidinol-phosphate transaminase [Kiritimatiellae bacterium]|nr:histidinol-phosphate transaminase [Kiritimatiellia bacterium]